MCFLDGEIATDQFKGPQSIKYSCASMDNGFCVCFVFVSLFQTTFEINRSIVSIFFKSLT